MSGRVLTFAGVAKCLEDVEPFQPDNGSRQAMPVRPRAVRWKGLCPGLVTLRDRRAAIYGGLAWAAPGRITRMMPVRSGVLYPPNP